MGSNIEPRGTLILTYLTLDMDRNQIWSYNSHFCRKLEMERNRMLLDDVNCYIVVTLSQGLSKTVAGVDDREVPVQNLMDLFDGI